MHIVSLSLAKQRATRALALVGVGVALAAAAAPAHATKPPWAHGPSHIVPMAHATGHKVG
jgi:hypothetical protein